MSRFTEEVIVKPMLSPAFSLNNTGSTPVTHAFFKTGLPCRKGQWRATDQIQLQTASGIISSSVCTPHVLWDDGSVRWFLVEGLCSLDAGQTETVSLQLSPAANKHLINPVKDSDSTLIIHCHNGNVITVSTDNELQFAIDGCQYGLRLKNGSNVFTPSITSQHYTVKYSAASAFSVDIALEATIATAQDNVLHLFLNITVLLDNGDCHLQTTLRNPVAATHPAGQWDLGDPNSVYIDECYLEACAPTKNLSISAHENAVEPKGKSYHLHQASSGFANWNSPVHVDNSGEVNLPFKGYRFTLNNELQKEGSQAVPVVEIQSQSDTHYVEVDGFWQNFPSSVYGDNTLTRVSLLGADAGPTTELQPGEQKTRCLHITGSPFRKLQVVLSPDYIASTQCLPFFRTGTPSDAIQQLIQKGITGDNHFFAKREAIDEFGWRHFGELYADHEKALTPDITHFVSHYNNQYDPINGCLNQWLNTSDERWFTMADDLAGHVADIDVYHTCDDKPEYSGGLFWHTDHYVQAYTATHRTYSKRQPTDVYDDHAGGGGPGGQHCYTNGLLLHYLLTGDPVSKDALLSICQWIETYYDGDDTGVGFLLSLKNSNTPGVKNIRTGQYPLDRGTGNYLQAMMDRYTLLGRAEDINKCAHIIYNTVSPEEDLAGRNLDNVELTWFYTVFLQAVCRFIQIKESLGQNDAAYAYAVRSLVHYAIWMTKNEYAYLDKPDILEFPNQTWTGQDLRKLCVLHFAKHYMNNDDATAAKRKADELLSIIESRLADSDESETTRLLCLMMQNANFDAYSDAANPMPLKTSYSTQHSLNTTSLPKAVFNALGAFSFKRERRQAAKRFPSLQKWLGKP